jgi:glutamyl-tRNA synthetase
MTVRVRFAPSPTGWLHLGGLRTALYNYLFAKKNGGTMILRIEDTDQSRMVPGASKHIQDMLSWCGITFDEGPGIASGHMGPYIQSERLDIYQSKIKELIDRGHAYPCYCQKERLDSLRLVNKDPVFRYDRHCLDSVSPSERQMRLGVPHVIRLKYPRSHTERMVYFDDIVFARQGIPDYHLDDVILLKSNGWPTYHFANVVDDHMMDITHVIRGQEWMPSTLLHIAIYKGFSWNHPQFAHLPLLVNPDGSKLSKRQIVQETLNQSTVNANVEYYKEHYYMPTALINFVSRLGWTPPTNDGRKGPEKLELLDIKQLIQAFDLKKVHQTPSVVVPHKLDFLNNQSIRSILSNTSIPISSDFLSTIRSIIKANIEPDVEISDENLSKILLLSSKQVHSLELDIPNLLNPFFKRPDFKKQLASELLKEHVDVRGKVAKIIEDIITLLGSRDLGIEGLYSICETITERYGDSKLVYSALRYSITGSKVGVPILPAMLLIGKDECLARLKVFQNEI